MPEKAPRRNRPAVKRIQGSIDQHQQIDQCANTDSDYRKPPLPIGAIWQTHPHSGSILLVATALASAHNRNIQIPVPNSRHQTTTTGVKIVTGFPRSLTVIRCLGLITGLLMLPLSHADLADVIDSVRPSIVGVGTSYPVRQPIGDEQPHQLLGTGFAVGDGSFIATNHHVLPEQLDRENRQILAVFVGRGREARMRPAEVIATDPEHDLALLQIQGDPLPALRLGDADSVREGEMMVFTGFPIGAVLGLYPVSHRGIVSSITPAARPADNAAQLSPAQLRRLRYPFNVFQLDAIAYPGNSGSPVYRESDGAVIGVLNSVFIKESREAVLERPSGISYAIPVNWLKALLEELQDSGG